MIYRVIKETTGSLQPGNGQTFWSKEVLYCGTDITEARIAYHEEEPGTYSRGYGNPCCLITFEIMDDDALADTVPGEFRAGDVGEG